MKKIKFFHCFFFLLFLFMPLCFYKPVQCKEISAYESIPKDEILTFQGHRYWFCNDTIIWSEAKERCEQLGGHLVTINSKEENDFITSLVKEHNSSYTSIGLTDAGTEGTWKWITGETSTYRNWDSGEPNNGLGWSAQNWAYMLIYGDWDDGWMSSKATYVCEWDTFILSAKANPQENCIDLQWESPAEYGEFSYMLKQRHLGEETSVFQSIPASSTVKVLQVYPHTPQLVNWVNAYGQGKITCDAITTRRFNADPSVIWDYDVTVFGFWDSNCHDDLNQSAIDTLKEYIESGKGVLFGHDTVWDYHRGFYQFAKYLNLNGTVDNVSSLNSSYYAFNDKVTVSKKGLLTNYPYQIGDIGTTLTIPLAHDTNALNNGDIWMTFEGSDRAYLSTWNNCAFIQTGHSNGAATEDEQKLIMNTLYYLAQRTSETSWQDHMGQDLTGPKKPSIEQFQINYQSRKIQCNVSSEDLGDEYEYYVEAMNTDTSEKTTSNHVTVAIATGICGYSYTIDNNADTIPDNSVDCDLDTIASSIEYSVELCKSTYLHVKAIDYANNVSETLHYCFGDLTAPSVPYAVPDNHKIYWLDCEDAESGISHYEYRVNDGDWNVLNEDSTFGDDAEVIAVRAVNCAGGVSESCIIEIDVDDDIVEPDELILDVITTEDGYNCLSWNSIADVDGITYYVYRKIGNEKKFELIGETTECSLMDKTITDMLNCKFYYYIVAKCDKFDDDVYSDIVIDQYL